MATAVPLVVGAALVSAALVLAATRSPAAALPVLLDLLLAAGLLRLSTAASWEAIASAALVVVVRKLAVRGLRQGERARSAPRPAPPSLDLPAAAP